MRCVSAVIYDHYEQHGQTFKKSTNEDVRECLCSRLQSKLGQRNEGTKHIRAWAFNPVRELLFSEMGTRAIDGEMKSAHGLRCSNVPCVIFPWCRWCDQGVAAGDRSHCCPRGIVSERSWRKWSLRAEVRHASS